MSGGRWLIYGANGYTGVLVAERAVAVGQRPVLAGRDSGAIRRVAERLDLPWRCVGLDDPGPLADALAEIDVVLCCAGPFRATSRAMVDACLATGTSYLDITGEIDVLEAVLARHDEAVAAGVTLLPGVGFDVVPTDCLAAMLAERLPGADTLELAVAAEAGLSSGTARTALDQLGVGRIRQAGRIVDVPPAHVCIEAPFSMGTREVAAVPLADVSTAYHTTGIANIVCYARLPRAMRPWARHTRPLGAIVRMGPVRRAAVAWIDRTVHGPDADARATARTHVWGRVTRGEDSVSGTLDVPEAYAFTATVAVEATVRVAAEAVDPGAWTPARAFGAQFVMGLGDVVLNLPLP